MNEEDWDDDEFWDSEEGKFWSACHDGNVDIVLEHLKNRVNVNVRAPDDGEPALSAAVRNNHIDVVLLLLKSGANPHLGDDCLWTSFTYAERHELGNILELLHRFS